MPILSSRTKAVLSCSAKPVSWHVVLAKLGLDPSWYCRGPGNLFESFDRPKAHLLVWNPEVTWSSNKDQVALHRRQHHVTNALNRPHSGHFAERLTFKERWHRLTDHLLRKDWWRIVRNLKYGQQLILDESSMTVKLSWPIEFSWAKSRKCERTSSFEKAELSSAGNDGLPPTILNPRCSHKL
jgi:hypothetical protein